MQDKIIKLTNKEAIAYFKRHLDLYCVEGISREAEEMAIKALEQEPEPIQVELTGDGYADGQLVYDYGMCPECGWQYEEGEKDWEEPFCCHCGQRLKWFDNKGNE